jgi:hypothetical protein
VSGVHHGLVRGHFLGGYLRPDIVTWILQVCLDDSYHVAPTVCQADDYPQRGHNGSAVRSAAARPQLAAITGRRERMKGQSSHFAPHRVLAVDAGARSPDRVTCRRQNSQVR